MHLLIELNFWAISLHCLIAYGFGQFVLKFLKETQDRKGILGDRASDMGGEFI